MHKSGKEPQDGGGAPQRARGRPRAFDRQAALAKATRLFWLKGYEATSILDITSALGISSPSLYSAFGSKEALYAEALGHYAETYKHLVWDGFSSAPTAREAVTNFLMDSAAALTGCVVDIPRGCMVALSSVGSEGYPELGELARSARSLTFVRVKERLERAVADGEIPASMDLDALARFVQTVQYGMSVLARDGAKRSDLEGVAKMAMLTWDARTSDNTIPPV